MRIQLLAVLASTMLINSCSWQTYVGSRVVRHITGAPTRFHSIVPIVPTNGGLQRYRVIEVLPLDNLLPGLLPEKTESYINDQIFKDMQYLKSRPKVIRTGVIGAVEDETDISPDRTLVFEGYVDDYDAGYAGLRLAELGFNHVAVTIRFQLRNKQSGEIVAAASITSQDDRATGSTKSAINKIANRIKRFINSGYGGDQ